jgi:hypothetical protein
MAMAPTQLTLSRYTLGGGRFNRVDAIIPRDIQKLVHLGLFRIQEAVATMGLVEMATPWLTDAWP